MKIHLVFISVLYLLTITNASTTNGSPSIGSSEENTINDVTTSLSTDAATSGQTTSNVGLSDQTTVGGVSDHTSEGGVSDQTTEGGVSDHTTESGETNQTTEGEVTVTDQTTEGGVSDQTTEGEVTVTDQTTEGGVSDQTTEGGVSDLTTESGVSDHTTESGETNQTTEGEVTVTDQTTEGGVSEQTTEGGTTNQTTEGEVTVTDQTTQGGVTDQTTEDGMSDQTTEGGGTDQTTEGGVSDQTTEGGVENQTTEDGVSDQTTEGGVSDQTTESGVSDQTTEGGVSDQTTGNGGVTDPTTDNGVSDQTTEGGVSDQTTDNGGVTNQTTDNGVPGQTTNNGVTGNSSPVSTTPALTTTQYPRPDLGNAIFKFDMNITIEMEYIHFIENHFRLFILEMILNACDNKLCKNYEIVRTWSGSVHVEGVLHVAASIFQGLDKSHSLDILKNTFSNVSRSTYDTYNMSVEYDPAYSEFVDDLCNAANVECDNGYYCDSSFCKPNCNKINCGAHGTCEALQDNTIVKCSCTSDTYYNYQGINCNDKALKWQVLVGISVAVAFVVIVVILIAFLCYCYKMRVKYSKGGRYADSLNDAFGLDASEMPLTNFTEKQEEGFQFYHNQKSKDGVINGGFAPADYDNAPEEQVYDNDHDGLTNQSLTSSFTANLRHIDPQADYSIKRPTFSVMPRNSGNSDTYEQRL